MTTWSKSDVAFTAASADVLLDAAVPQPEAASVMVHSSNGYTTNLA